MEKTLVLTLIFLLSTACTGLQTALNSAPSSSSTNSSYEVVPISDVKWEQLNPARGDKSPQAGTLWGDRRGLVPTGFLAKFVDGFSSPPHIHNATYRAVVIKGLIHNDDPDAARMWMPAGSFWTQPKGEAHITAAKGSVNMALVEIDRGPYLVLPTNKAFDSGERPINVDPSNIVWVGLPGVPATDDNGPKLAYLWGSLQEGQSNGTFIKLPPGFTGKISSNASSFRAVVIKGQLQYLRADSTTLKPGSYFGSQGELTHRISSQIDQETILYIRTEGEYKLLGD